MKLEFIAILAGLALHQTEKMVAHLDTSITVKRLCRYAIGVIGTKQIYDLMKKDEDTREQAFTLSFVFVGLGVMSGYIVDSFSPHDH